MDSNTITLTKNQQMYLLSCFLLLAVITLVLIPKNSTLAPYNNRELNELERQEAMARAADGFMLGETHAERQAAAWEVQSLRTGSRSIAANDTTGFYTFLRIVLFITILVLAWRIFVLINGHFRLKPNQA
ncbi:hypothetical protein KAU08_04710 [bacterium]|nr:hypothetical protein [bacterium]